MSSFRIDRQYVAFETAETQPVYATNKNQEAKSALTDDTTPSAADISKIYNEIYERLQNEHAEQAEYMLSKAADEAHEIIAKAKKDAEEMMLRARLDTEKMRDELIFEMEAASSLRKSQAETILVELETTMRNDYSKLVEGMRSDVIALVMEIVRKIIGIKLAQSDEIFVGMIQDALERLKQTGSIIIRVCPEDYARYFSDERGEIEFDSGDFKISAVEDPNFSQGDLIIESEGEMIDLGIHRQIDLIEKAFLN